MPGHVLARTSIVNKELYDKYLCPCCNRLLKDAVQPVCGHWVCESCIVQLLASSSPQCPRPDCQENLQADDSEEGAEYFPDRFVRREISQMRVVCPHQQKGCQWEDALGRLATHLHSCQYTSSECPHCREPLTADQMAGHVASCPQTPMKCPLADFGCSQKQMVPRVVLNDHILENIIEHFEIVLRLSKGSKGSLSLPSKPDLIATFRSSGLRPDVEERDGVAKPKGKAIGAIRAVVAPLQRVEADSYLPQQDASLLNDISLSKVTRDLKMELESEFIPQIRSKDEEIRELRATIAKLDRTVRAKHAELEDRDFRLSLMENCNYDGFMIWKIPQFSQRMADAQSGKYTSIFSLPFYSNRYGYKMCLRLYILGDGIGKGSHMSLFFVVMKGEFDNVLGWPFTHKVTFKLLNQTGRRDVVDAFQPDPMSSSFKKPKSDMNIASGCPRFVSHGDLKNNGFIVDDTVFIKCSVDLNTIKHP